VVPSLIDSGSGWEINLVRRVLQFAIQIIVQGRYEGTFDAGVRRVVSRSLAGGVDIGPFETRVVAAEDGTLIAKQFFAESRRAHAKVSLFDVCHAEARVTGKAHSNCIHLRLRQPMPAGERLGIGAAGKRAHFVEECLFVPALARDLFIMPGDRRIRGQVSDEERIGTGRQDEVVQNRRHQNDAVK
jgi:hypothetical protein